MGLFKRHRYTNYSDIPWYRTSAFNSFVTFLLLAGFFGPVILRLLGLDSFSGVRELLWTPGWIWLIVILATGDVYFNDYDEKGRLKTWSKANKVVAVVVLVVTPMSYFVRVFL